MQRVLIAILIGVAGSSILPENPYLEFIGIEGDAATVGPINPYPPQNTKIPNIGVNAHASTCRLGSWINANNIDALKTTTKFRYWMTRQCSHDRGLFVIDDKKYSGRTFSCSDMPADWVPGKANPTIDDVFAANSGQTLIEFLNTWVEGVYNTSIIKSGSTCPFTAGYVQYDCGEHSPPYMRVAWGPLLGKKPIRGVNMGGLFVLEPWINQGFYKWDEEVRDQLTLSKKAKGDPALLAKLLNHFKTWYNEADFADMKAKGLNAVRLPVGWWYFAEAAGVTMTNPYVVPTEKITDANHPITQVLGWANKNGIKVLLDLHGAPCSQNGFDNSGNISSQGWQEWGEYWLYTKSCQDAHIKTVKYMSTYIVDVLPGHGIHETVLGLELVNEPWIFLDPSLVRDFYFRAIYEIRKMTTNMEDKAGMDWTYKTLPLVMHDSFRQFIWHDLLKHYPLQNVYMDTHLYHSFNIADVASDTHACAMQKQVIHNYLACVYGQFVRFESCTAVPTLVGEWSLAIDNCMSLLNGIPKGQNTRPDQTPFGQCKHGDIKERHTNPFWVEHIRDFANKQMIAFEQDLGWFFWTFKLDEKANEDPSSYFWSFKQAWGLYFVPPFNATACHEPPYINEAYPTCNEQSNPTPTADVTPYASAPSIPSPPPSPQLKEENEGRWKHLLHKILGDDQARGRRGGSSP
eukprot:TRINITY_DN66573_c8_g1_i1.p1 TRINITY_DN66573_c8_g1~~TRINITY_DN66573_c8_g1_i1.p1  ORF type:complete len:686 (-),score=109.44 TRINITY_DN66573_c8_g1_i1:32-2089(-)